MVRPLYEYLSGAANDRAQAGKDVLSGFTVSLALVPEAVAFAFVAGLAPLSGLYAAFIVGLVTALMGGRPGMISGATGALAVVMVSLVSAHGAQYLFACVVLMGVLQLIAGALRWGKFIRMVPHPVMLGFVNGLAIVIGLAQLEQFKTTDGAGVTSWLAGSQLYITLALVVATMVIIWLTPKLTNRIPPPLMAIGLVTGLVLIFDVNVPRISDLASLAGGFPRFIVPDVPFARNTANYLALCCYFSRYRTYAESSLTLNLVGDMTEQRGALRKNVLRKAHLMW